MKKQTKNILAVGGVIGTVMGIVGVIPSFSQEKYLAATGCAILIVAGLVLLAISFGE